MRHRKTWLPALAALAALGLAGTAQAVPSLYPTGTVKYDPTKAYGGYLLIGSDVPRLVDMNGNLVKEWSGYNGMPNKVLPGGRLLTSPGTWSEGQQDNLALLELDFDGNTLWEFRKGELVPAVKGQPVQDGKTWIARQHHDFQRKGTPPYPVPGQSDGQGEVTLVLAHINERVERVNKEHQLVSDIFYEVDAKGEIVWSWKPSDHLDDLGFGPDAFGAMQNYPPVDNPVAGRHVATAKSGGGYDWLHVNCLSYVGPNRWYDEDPVKYAAFNPDNVLFNCRDANLMAIVDRKSGNIVWRLGPDFSPGTPDAKVGQIVGAHGAHIIPKGLPGAGNLLFFDNGGTAGYGAPNPAAPVTGFHNVKRDYSRVVEFNPVTKEIVWEYDWYKNHKGILGHFGFRFFSPFVSYAQRLPNGNTLITEGDMGRVFELTPKYEMVWEYMTPYAPDAPLYRTYRVPYDFFPQMKKPEEVAVTPPDRTLFQLPNDKGEYPDTGIQGDKVRVISAGVAAEQGLDEDDLADEQPQGMHSY